MFHFILLCCSCDPAEPLPGHRTTWRGPPPARWQCCSASLWLFALLQRSQVSKEAAMLYLQRIDTAECAGLAELHNTVFSMSLIYSHAGVHGRCWPAEHI